MIVVIMDMDRSGSHLTMYFIRFHLPNLAELTDSVVITAPSLHMRVWKVYTESTPSRK
jgi:hypothetical protein